VAVNLMVTAKIAGVPLESTFRWVGWLLLGMAVALALIVLFPELALWLPRVLGYRIT
jgi:TRAP-type C4-dicarboxylate transport system permease large subunit